MAQPAEKKGRQRGRRKAATKRMFWRPTRRRKREQAGKKENITAIKNIKKSMKTKAKKSECRKRKQRTMLYSS